MRGWTCLGRRPGPALLGAALALSMVGQSSAAAADTESGNAQAAWYAQYRSGSRLVDIGGGRKLNLFCMGKGGPVVILDAGLTESSFTWWAVQARIARQTKVCTYDRAGLGKSPRGPFPRDTLAHVADLRALLKSAAIKSPIVYVGHSMAGFIARVLAAQAPRDIAGMVLVDPAGPGQLDLEKTIAAIAANDERQSRRARACADPARTAEVAGLCTRKPPAEFPPDLAADFRASYSLDYSQTVLSEMQSFRDLDLAQVSAHSRSLGAIPVIVLTRGKRSADLPMADAETEWSALLKRHQDIARASSRGEDRVVEGAGHYIHVEKPEAVVTAVSDVVDRIRAGARNAAQNHIQKAR